MNYSDFIARKSQLDGNFGFKANFIPEKAFDFQAYLIEWSVLRGRSAIFADCGLGKTPIQLAWAQNILEKENRPVLVLTPLAVAAQTVREGKKFGIEAKISRDGKFDKGIVVTNYEKLKHFNPADFASCVCDESSILKNFDGATNEAITEFMRTLKYRLLCTATAAPNDYPELGTSSECLGDLGHMDMLAKFFKNDQNSNHPNRLWSGNGKWRFRGHAEHDFWRWVCSWARAIRKPSDLGFSDEKFVLPELVTRLHMVECEKGMDGFLPGFTPVARGLQEEIKERRRTLDERCEMAAKLCSETKEQSIAWCNLNPEGDLLEKLLEDSVQVAGKDSDEEKEEKLMAFVDGKVKTLISKTDVAGFGLNLQNAGHQTHFADNSFERYYQGVRRSWRFGRKKPVVIDMIASEGQTKVLANHERKCKAAEAMFSSLVSLMNNELRMQKTDPFTQSQIIPSWLKN